VFSPHAREEALSRLGDGFDLLILGGGITGCGVLMEAAQRGLSALLVEKGDLASGTSSRSSKLIHGGLRYLKQMQLHLTRLSCRERDRYLHLNPELVRPLRFVYPVRQGDPVPGWVMEMGLHLYDRFTERGRRHRRLEPDRARELAPELAVAPGDTAFTYHDGVADDARLTLAVAATGVAAGGRLLTRTEALEATRDAGGRITGVVVRDLETGETHTVTASLVVNATGVWVDEMRQRAGVEGRRLRPSRGSHIVLPPRRLPLSAAVAAPAPEDGRPIFLIPHPEGVLVGTTDLFHHGSLDDPRPGADEVSYLLRAAQALFPERDLGEDDIVGAFAGLRPILDDEAEEPSKASRDEAVWEEDGLLSVAGGKLTTWRAMAETAVDEALEHLPPERRRAAGPSVSEGTALVGRAPVDLGERLAGLWSRRHGASPEVAHAAARRLRALAGWLPRLARDDRELQPLVDGSDLSAAEVRAHLAFGAVRRLEDLLLRRVRIGMWNPGQARDLVARVPELRSLFQDELGWDAAKWAREEEAFALALDGWSRPG
jgi:glycerol-3-phosphate dehydrogenase